MIKRRLIVILVLVVLTGCVTAPQKVTVTQGFAWVSIIRLIANPVEYDGQNVQVKGYFVYERQGVSDRGYLFLDQTSYIYQLTKNALAVKIPQTLIGTADRLDGKYVILNGAFSRHYLGPWSLYAAGVTAKEMYPIISRGAPRPAPDSH